MSDDKIEQGSSIIHFGQFSSARISFPAPESAVTPNPCCADSEPLVPVGPLSRALVIIEPQSPYLQSRGYPNGWDSRSGRGGRARRQLQQIDRIPPFAW